MCTDAQCNYFFLFQIVENPDLTGIDYLWRVSYNHCPSMYVAHMYVCMYVCVSVIVII